LRINHERSNGVRDRTPRNHDDHQSGREVRIARRLQANADYVSVVWESLEPRYRDFGVEVPSVTVEQFCAKAADFGIDEVDLIKLDCEGSEYLIVSELPALYVLPVSKCQ
jgi:FkbM family methyltransferase